MSTKQALKTGKVDRRRKRDTALAVISLSASLLAGLIFSKANWAALFLAPLAYFALDWIATFLPRRSGRQGFVQLLLAVIISLSAWEFYLKAQYHAQRAAVLEGDLVPISGDTDNGQDTILQIGSQGPKFRFGAGLPKGTTQFRFAYDAGLRVQRGANGLEISTPVRDRQGVLVGEVSANHWKVYPPYCSDKNYNDHSIEMKDPSGHVVLQVTLFKDKVQVQGEWHTPFGQGEQLIEDHPGGELIFWQNAQEEQHFTRLIDPMFLYPSSLHWSELAATQR